jgi:glycosyltransferase involved in cell wall biosynthesis
MSLRVCHLVRPAEGGMRSQVRSLLDDDSLLAAPPPVLAALSEHTKHAPYPLSASGSLRAQWRDGRNVGRWARGRADVLHGHGLSRVFLFLVAATTSNLPFVVTLHNLVPELSFLELVSLKIALGRARKIICVSEAVAKSASQIVPGHRKIAIHNGIVLESHGNVLEQHVKMPERRVNVSERHDNMQEEHGNVLEQHDKMPERHTNVSEEPGNLTVFCVARLSPEKGIDILLENARKLPKVQFIIAGDGPERENLEKNSSQNVTFLGFVKDIPNLLAQADILCVPSRSEGLGLAALEAMAAGVPVVASRVGGLPEVIRDGETGLLVPPEDSEALHLALKTLLDDPERRKSMGAAGRKRAEALFSVEVMREKTRAVWEEARR